MFQNSCEKVPDALLNQQLATGVTFNEVQHLGLHVLQQNAHADSGEVAVGHLLVPQHPLQKPLQVGLGGLQALPTAGEIRYVRRSLSAKEVNKYLYFYYGYYNVQYITALNDIMLRAEPR